MFSYEYTTLYLLIFSLLILCLDYYVVFYGFKSFFPIHKLVTVIRHQGRLFSCPKLRPLSHKYYERFVHIKIIKTKPVTFIQIKTKNNSIRKEKYPLLSTLLYSSSSSQSKLEPHAISKSVYHLRNTISL